MNPSELHSIADLFRSLAKEKTRTESSLREAANRLHGHVYAGLPSAREAHGTSADPLPPEGKLDLATALNRAALEYHKTIEGEYGCPGMTCPGVKRLQVFAASCAALALQYGLPSVGEPLKPDTTSASISEASSTFPEREPELSSRKPEVSSENRSAVPTSPEDLLSQAEASATYFDQKSRRLEADLTLLRSQVREMRDRWRSDADQEALDRVPGWVGAQARLRSCAKELDALLVRLEGRQTEERETKEGTA